MYGNRANEQFSFRTKVEGLLSPNDIRIDRNEALEASVKVAEVVEELDSSRRGMN